MALLLREAHTEALAAKALEVHRRLCAGYERPIPFFSDHDPLSQLVGNLLSHRSKNHHTGRAFRAPLERFGTWEAVQNAPVEAVQEAIQGVTWPEQKAPRIQAMLREITRRVRKLELDFLGQMTIPQARHWLERLSGVDPKTSAATLLFSRLRMPALPVDSHHRVALRLGLLPEGTPSARLTACSSSSCPRTGAPSRSTTTTKFSCCTASAVAIFMTRPVNVRGARVVHVRATAARQDLGRRTPSPWPPIG
jgi:endonuclease III